MRKYAVIWIAFIVVAGPFFLGLAVGDYTSHAPIRIDSNSEFASLASSEGWTGSGTTIDPYIIAGLEISGSGDAGHGIYIGNVTSSFIIQGCHLHNVTDIGASDDYFNSGLILFNVENGKIIENTVKNNAQGIRLINSNNNYIYHNNFITNTVQAYDDGSNSWDNGSISGGNYWSNWITPDANSDGFVDNAYGIPGPGPSGTLTIIFLEEVGNGDGTLIISPSGEAMLIDAGDMGNGSCIVILQSMPGIDGQPEAQGVLRHVFYLL